MQLSDLDGLIALHDVQLVQLLFRVLILVVQGIVGLDDAGGYLDQRILSDKRIHDGLEYISGFRLGEVVIRFENLVGLHIDTVAGFLIRAGEQLYDIVHQVVDVTQLGAGTHGYRNHSAVAYVELHRRTDLTEGELLAVEIALHKFVRGLCYCIQKRLTADRQVFLGIFGNLAFFALADIGEPATRHLADIDVTHELLIFTDGLIERRDLLAVQIGQILYHLTEGRVVHIHLGYEEHSRQLILLAEIPCLLGAYLHAGLTGYHDNRRVSR